MRVLSLHHGLFDVLWLIQGFVWLPSNGQCPSPSEARHKQEISDSLGFAFITVWNEQNALLILNESLPGLKVCC